MPKITKLADFKFTVEQFLDACSRAELKEVDLLIQSNRYQSKMNPKAAKIQRLQDERDEISALGFDPDYFLGKSK